MYVYYLFCLGHANPHIMESISQCLSKGILTGAPGPDNIQAASILASLYDPSLAYWRFSNSGTEATRDAIQVGYALSVCVNLISDCQRD